MKRKRPSIIKILLLLVQVIFVWSDTTAQKLDWVQQIGSNKETGANRMITDGEGHLYVLGPFEDSVIFNPRFQTPDTLVNSSSGRNGLFLAKFDTSGRLIWRKDIGGQEYVNRQHCIGLDRAGNIFVAGGFTGTMEFQTLSGTVSLSTLIHPGFLYPVEGFVCKLNSSGDYIWAKKIGEGSRTFSPFRLTADNSGNVILTGAFSDTSDLDPGLGTFLVYGDPNTPGSVDIFICKLDGNGNFLWGGETGGHWADMPHDITTDAQDNIFVTGYFGGAADFDIGSGTHILVSFGLEDIFIWKLRSNGTLDWVKQYGGPSWDDWGTAIEVDHNGFIYLAGCYDFQLDFGGSSTAPLMSRGEKDIFVSKLDNQGNYIWAKSMGGKKMDTPYGITVGLDGHVYVTGCFADTATFGSGPDSVQLIANGMHDIFICKFDNNGNQLWVKAIGGPTNTYQADYGNAILVDQQHSMYVIGGFTEAVDFDPGNGTHILSSTSGNMDGYLLKLLCADDKTGMIRDSACISYSFHNNSFTQSGVYNVMLQNTSGCDSALITLDLTIIQMAPVIIRVDGNIATTTQSYTSYQWFKNGIAEQDSTGSSYTITENGDYMVVVTNDNGCIDTSDIYSVNNVSVSYNYNHKPVSIYPNPAKETLFIESPEPYRVYITDIQGRKIKEIEPTTNSVKIGHLVPGIYYAHILGPEGEVIHVHTFVKE